MAAPLNDHRTRMDSIVRTLVVALVKLLRSVSGRKLTDQQVSDLVDVLRDAIDQSRQQAHEEGWSLFLAVRGDQDEEPAQPPYTPLSRKYVEKVLKTNLPRLQDSQKADAGISDLVGTASRSVEDASRAITMRSVGRDPKALGYARVLTGRETCGFCSMLASRGPVYKKDSFDRSDSKFFGAEQQKVHDRCDCLLVPVYDRSSWPGRDEYLRLEKLWISATKGKRGKDALNAFRQAVETPDSGQQQAA